MRRWSGASPRSRPKGSLLARAALAIGALAIATVALWALLPTAPGVAGGPSASRVADVPSPAASGTGSPSGRWFTHAYVIMMENREYGQIVGNPAAPYLNHLIATYGLDTRYYSVTHGSQPDYVDLLAGTTLGVVDNTLRNFSAPTLLDQLDRRGLSWHVYAQDYPGHCFAGAVATGGVDLVGAPGTYERAHNPAISFDAIRTSPTRCADISPLASFDPAAANVEFIVPNLANDMDQGSVAAGDAFLRAFVPRILASPAFAHGILFITWDEGTTNAGAAGPGTGGGHVPLIAAAPWIGPGQRSGRIATEHSLLRTLEDNWGLGCLAGACSAADLQAFLAR